MHGNLRNNTVFLVNSEQFVDAYLCERDYSPRELRIEEKRQQQQKHQEQRSTEAKNKHMKNR